MCHRGNRTKSKHKMYCTIQIVSTVKHVYKGHSREPEMWPSWAVALYIQVTIICTIHLGEIRLSFVGSYLLYRGGLKGGFDCISENSIWCFVFKTLLKFIYQGIHLIYVHFLYLFITDYTRLICTIFRSIKTVEPLVIISVLFQGEP